MAVAEAATAAMAVAEAATAAMAVALITKQESAFESFINDETAAVTRLTSVIAIELLRTRLRAA